MAQCDSIRDYNLHHWVRGLTGNFYHIYTSLSFSQFWGSHPLSLLFLICGTSNLGRQLLALMEELIADDYPIEKNQKMNTMHTHAYPNHNLFEGLQSFSESRTWPKFFRDERLIDLSPTFCMW